MMIPESVELTPGLRVRHDEGLLYRVEDTRRSTADYETTHELGEMTVNYVQLEDGACAAGTKWNKDEAGFRAHFTVEERAANHGEPQKEMHNDFSYYDPALVSTVELDDGRRIAAITRAGFIEFAEANGFTMRIATTAFNTCARKDMRSRLGETDVFTLGRIIIGTGDDETMYDKGHRYTAVRLEQYPEYVRAFIATTLETGMGPAVHKFLKAFDRALRTPPAES
jgi:hypothetical protein